MIVNIFGLDLDRYPSYFDPRASLKSDARSTYYYYYYDYDHDHGYYLYY